MDLGYLASGMNLYVYRLSATEYGAGLGLDECRKRGEIIERWPLNTPEQAAFLARHGTHYAGAMHLVTRMANLVHELMVIDPTFRPEPDKPITASIPQPQPKPAGRLQRILSWCFDR